MTCYRGIWFIIFGTTTGEARPQTNAEHTHIDVRNED